MNSIAIIHRDNFLVEYIINNKNGNDDLQFFFKIMKKTFDELNDNLNFKF